MVADFKKQLGLVCEISLKTIQASGCYHGHACAHKRFFLLYLKYNKKTLAYKKNVQSRTKLLYEVLVAYRGSGHVCRHGSIPTAHFLSGGLHHSRLAAALSTVRARR